MKKYITTTLPYVNADPHMGFALEIVHADIIARHWRMRGHDVFFNTGTDEHGLKILRKAEERGIPPQDYVDEMAERFRLLGEPTALNISFDAFIRTTNEHHKRAAQEFWRRCAARGDIYKKMYAVKYCVGCELEKTGSELDERGCCPLHPDQALETIEEENYFFRFSRYQNELLDLYEKTPHFVIPESRLGEIRKFVLHGLEDFSISRLAAKMPWGVPVPDDREQVMYVWFDALVNYISTLGWPDDDARFRAYWLTAHGAPHAVQIAGKDNLRQQAAMWQAMLLSAGVAPSRHIIIHGFVTSGGQKMSKSRGNVIDPRAIVADYGTDALRYFLAREMPPFEDGDFTKERFTDAYNANLANGLGNLVARVMKLAETHLAAPVVLDDAVFDEVIKGEYELLMDRFEIQKAADLVWRRIGELDRHVEETKPFETIKTDENKAQNDIVYLVGALMEVAHMLTPFMPETAATIKAAIGENKMPETLFARK